MADDTLKRLLIKLGIDTRDWKVAVNEIKSQLDSVNAKAKADAASMKTTQKEQIALTRQQITDQQRLVAEAKTMASVDQAKATWERKNQEALKTKIQAQILSTVEATKQNKITQANLKLEQEQLRLKQQQLNFDQRSADVQTKKNRDLQASQKQINKEKLEEEERIRRIAAQSRIAGAVQTAGGAPVTGLTEQQILQSRSVLVQEKQKLALMEAELKIQSTQAGVKREDLVLAEKQIAEERAKLSLQEAQLVRSERALLLQKQIERERATTVDKASVDAIKQKVGLSPFTQPQVGGVFGTGGLLGPSVQATINSVNNEKTKLSVMQAELKVMAQEEEYRKVDIAAVQRSIIQEKERLDLITMQLRERKEQSLFNKVGERVREVTGGLHSLLGGGLVGGIITGGLSIEAFNKVIEKVGELKADLVGATGPAQQLRTEFEKLASLKNINPDEFLVKFRQGTRGLVADLDLFKVANTFLRSSLHLTDEQIIKLTSDTVNLARANGRSAQEATQALQRYFTTGRTFALGSVTGISRQNLALPGLSSSLDVNQKRTIEFNNVLLQEEKMLKRVGVAATTVPELLQQITVAQQNFVEGIAKGLTGSNNFGEAIGKISTKLSDMAPKLEENAVAFGKHLGDALKFVIDNFQTLKTIVEGFLVLNLAGKMFVWATSIKEVAVALGILKSAEEAAAAAEVTKGAVTGIAAKGVAEGAGVAVGAEGAGWLAALGGIGGLALTVTGVLGALGLGWLLNKMAREEGDNLRDQAIERNMNRYGYPSAPKTKAPGAFFGPTYRSPEEVGGISESAAKSFDQLNFIRSEVSNKLSGKFKDDQDSQVNLALQKKLAQQRLELAKLTNKILLDETKQRISEEEQALKDSYDDGIISLREYVSRDKSLKSEQHQANLTQIEEDKKAELAKIQVGSTITIGDQTFDVENQEIKANLVAKVNQQYRDKEIEETTRFNTTIHGLDKQLLSDQLAARKEFSQALLSVSKKGVEERIAILEKEFSQGNIGVDDYINTRKALIQEEYQLTVQGLLAQREVVKNNAQEVAKIDIDLINARVDSQKQLTSVTENEEKLRLKSVETHYDKAKKFLEIQEQIISQSGSVTATQQQVEIQTTLLSITQKYLETQKQLLKTEQQGSDAWMDTQEHIAQATLEEEKLKEQIAQTKDLAAPIGNMFGAIGGIFDQLHSKTAQAIGELFGQISSSMEKLSKFSLQMQKQNAFKQIGGGIAGLFGKGRSEQTASKTGQELFDDNANRSASTLNVFTGATREAAAVLMELRNKISSVTESLGREAGSPKALQSSENASSDFDIEDLYAVPKFQVGASIGQTGLGFVHSGEEIVSAGNVSVINKLISTFRALDQTVTSLVQKFTSVSLSPVQSKPILTSQFSGTQPQSLVTSMQRYNAPQHTSIIDSFKSAFDGGSSDSSSLFSGGNSTEKLNAAFSKLSTSADQASSSLQGVGKSDSGGAPSGMGTDDGDDPDSGGSKGGSLSGSMSGLMNGISNLAGGIQGLVQGLTAGKSGAGGALSGGMAGMQFGMSVGGPIGAAIGLVGGGIAGGIFGSKEKQLNQDMHKIQTQMQSIVDSMNAGTISMGQAITDLRNERQKAVQMLSQDPKGNKGGGKGGKKGYSPTQAQAVIEQIDSEISQLVNEQTQMLQNLHQAVMELSEPVQFQDYINSLDQIIQKYQQFASAASGNSQEVALANQYLTDSLQQYVTTLSQQLNQAQQTAINDALTLINLEYQRQQLLNQTAQQEYDILTQGVAVRQRTTAMTKGQQIGQLEYQRDMQLQQMDEEIALTQHKVDAETKIFGLAQTRIGLEAQLLQAQEEQADYQIAQIQALAQIISSLGSGLATGNIAQQISQMFANGSMPTGSGLLYMLLQELGLGGNVPPNVLTGPYGTQNWLEAVPQQYQSAAQYVYQQDPQFYNDFESAAGTDPGSSQRQRAIADVSPLVSQGTVEGYDMQGLINFLENGSIPTMHSGGPVNETGLIVARQGEYMLDDSDVGTIKRLLNGINRGNSSYQANLQGSVNTQAHAAMLSMTQQRSSIELNIISARQQHLSLEMQYLQALNTTLSNIQNMSPIQLSGSDGSGTNNLEAMLQKVYETRGRQGSGNFRRTVP